MSNNLRKCLDKLKFIAKVKDLRTRRKLLLEMSDNCLFKALHEIALNTMKGKVKLNKSQMRKISKYRKNLTALSNKNYKRKKHLIKQSGGWLPILIPAVASILGSLINR